jgi:hypothetical protein
MLAITTLLAEVSFVNNFNVFGGGLVGAVDLADSSTHALRHVLLYSAFGTRNVKQLELKVANYIRRTANRRRVVSSLAADTVDDGGVFLEGPLIVARHVDSQWTTKAVLLVGAEVDVSTSEGSIIAADELVKKIPCSWS